MLRLSSSLFRATLWGALIVIALIGCKSEPEPPSNASDYIEYVSAYTSGLVSKEAEIRIVLAKPFEGFTGANTAADAKLLSINPKIEGELFWADQNSLVFKPSALLPAAQSYQVTLQLSDIFSDVPAELQKFNFNFQVLDQSYAVSNINLRSYSTKDLTKNSIVGEVISGDVADVKDLNSLLMARQNGKEIKVKWRQDASRKLHFFVLDSLTRSDKTEVIEFEWNKNENLGDVPATFEIPALGDFKVIGVNVIQSPEQKVIINFSDPLDEEQNLTGLVYIEDAENTSLLINNNELHVIINGTISGERKLVVHQGIKNSAGYAFKESYETGVTFMDVKPAVEMIGNGNILPKSGNLALPFRAVNLSAVDVYVLKIYADNVPQFLQTNQLEGDYQLKRVGRPIAYKRIDLAGSTNNLKQWNNFSIDLAKMVQPEPGAVYRIELKFKQAYSLYSCDNATEAKDVSLTEVATDELSTAEYDNPNSYYWDDYYYEDFYWDDYDYSERDNPCNVAYFSSSRSVARNILATNLALTVKGGDKGVFTAIVTDIITSKPVDGAKIQFLNYQQQQIKTGVTNADGILKLDLKAKPFMAIATHNNQSAYLRIDDGSSLSLSNFDVSGSQVQKGLKGFIYAERGVWRPGDTVHTQFMLEDADKALPQNHPVIFEVRNPEGKLVERQVKSTHVSGIYSFPFVTAESAITGFYSAQVRVGGVSFQKSIRIETIKPNRLKIKMSFDEDVLQGNEVVAKLHANWLTGATARSLKADISMQVRQQNQPFEKFSKYNFNDETRSFYSSESTVFEGNLNAEGDAMPNIALGNYNQSPGMLQAIFVTRVFEPGGDMSIDRQAFDYAPYDYFVGILPPTAKNAPWLQTDNPITVGVASVNAKGKAQNRKLTAEVYAIDWSWWWSSGRNGMANYVNSSYVRSIGSFEVNTKEGKGSFNFQVKYPNYGNYLIRVCDEESGHCASQIVYVDWPMSRDRSGRSNPGAPTMLTFSADKENYNTGDVAHLSIPTSKSGRLLVSLETGAEVLKTFWVNAEEGQTDVEVPITDEMTPNVYAFVSYIQPHSKTVNDLPIRLYGVIPITVNNAKTKLQPVLKTAAEWQPENKAEIVVSEANGRAMTYTIAVVDEGLLDITRFKTPDPWNHFYAKEALGIRTWDYFDDIMGAFGGVIKKNFAIGGDQELDPSGKKRLNRFTPIVKVLGPYKLAAGATAKHNFTMPNYIGSVRVMLVARHEEAYGNAEKAVPVRKPLMVLATLPRVVGPGEKLRLPVQVFAMKDNVKNVKVALKTNSFFTAKQSSAQLTFDAIGDQMAYFELEVMEKTGKGVVDVTVTSGSEKATYQVAIEVRNPNSIEQRSQTAMLKPGESKTFDLEAFGMKGTNKISVQASGIPELNLAEAIAYLTRYPHGCIEQTVSAAFPQLYLAELTSLSNEEKTLTKQNVLYALNKLQANQMGTGGFSTWPSSTNASAWSSTYAGHFMIEAEKMGYAIPAGMKDRWLKYEKNAASNWQYNQRYYWQYMEQSYRLYVLALAGQPDLGAMNRFRNNAITKEAAWRLAAAYIIAGQKSVGEELMRKEFATHSSNYYDPTFGSEMRASAMRLENYMLLKDDTKAFEQAVILAKQLSNKNLYTTQGTAFAIINMAGFLKNKQADALKLSWQAGKENANVEQSKQLYLQKLVGFSKQVVLTNNGRSDLYVNIAQQGQPLPGREQKVVSGLSASVTFKTLDGSLMDVSAIPQGSDFRAIVTISSTADKYKLYDMALTQIFPSGWEIINTRLLEIDDISSSSYAHYKDIRDDRVYTYFDINSTSSRTYEVRLNAAYMGKYYMSGVKVEAMYYPEVVFVGDGKWVEVVANK